MAGEDTEEVVDVEVVCQCVREFDERFGELAFGDCPHSVTIVSDRVFVTDLRIVAALGFAVTRPVVRPASAMTRKNSRVVALWHRIVTLCP
ncbi:hypothetical protein GCM10023317_29980 [Actinopolymorpha pittospori]